jgi:hypothetical protein
MEYEKLYSCEYELFSKNIVYRSYIIFHSRRKFDLYMYNDGNQLDVYLNQKFTDVENMIDEYGRVSNLEKKRKENGIIIH